MSIIISIFYLALAIWFIAKHRMFRLFKGSREAFIILFLLKIIAAFSLTAIYTWYYTDRSTADIFKYFDDAKVIYKQLPQSPINYIRIVFGIDTDAPHLKTILDQTSYWFKEFDYRLYNDNRTIIRLNAIILLFSFGHFAVHNIFLSFLSFIGLYGIFRLFFEQAPHKRWYLLCAVFCVPGVLFWGSGVLKESFLLFLFGSFLYCCNYLIKNTITLYKKAYIYSICALLILLLMITKYYVIICSLPALCIWLFALKYRTSAAKTLLFLIITFCIIGLLFIVNQYVYQFYNILETVSLKHNDFVNMAQALPNTGSLVETFHLQATIADFISHTPWALSKSFLQPFPWQIHSIPMFLSAFENFILVALLFCLCRWFDHKIGLRPITLFSIIFVVLLFWLNGLVTPVLGALVRYKVPALPFLFACIILYIDFSRIPFIKKNDKINAN